MVKDIVIKYGGSFTVRPNIMLVPNDVQAYRVVLTTPYNLDGHIFKVTAMRADGVVIEDSGSVQDDTAYYVLKNNMHGVPGDLVLRLTLCSPGGTILTDKELYLSVADANGQPDISGDDRVPILDNLLLTAANTAQNAEYAKAQGDYAKTQGDTLQANLDKKADRKTEDGGFEGGEAMTFGGGGAIGKYAFAGDGFAGGKGACTGYFEGLDSPIPYYVDAIQLGTGTNVNPNTLQIYDHQLLDAEGHIPEARIPQLTDKQTEWIVTTEGTGTAYTATLDPAPKELYVGMQITIIPHVSSSSSSATLNVNNTGAKYFRQRGRTTGTLYSPNIYSFLTAGKPTTLLYDGTYWVMTEYSRANWNDIKDKPETILQAENIKAGDNIVVSTEGNDVTISATGGSSGGSVNVVDNLTSTSTTSALSANQGKVLNEKKADKQTTQGGFVAGEGAVIYDESYPSESGTGGAIGKGAEAYGGGGAVGSGTYTEEGGAVGKNAKTMSGGAVGSGAEETGCGGAVGQNTYTSTGFAGGWNAKSIEGGAVGENAKTGEGFAGGRQAKTVDAQDNGIDAIQLGTGTNSAPKTLQVYNYQLLDADGHIPAERLANAPGGSGSGKVKYNGIVIGNSAYHTAADCDYLYTAGTDFGAFFINKINGDENHKCNVLLLKGDYTITTTISIHPDNYQISNLRISGEVDLCTGEKYTTLQSSVGKVFNITGDCFEFCLYNMNINSSSATSDDTIYVEEVKVCDIDNVDITANYTTTNTNEYKSIINLNSSSINTKHKWIIHDCQLTSTTGAARFNAIRAVIVSQSESDFKHIIEICHNQIDMVNNYAIYEIGLTGNYETSYDTVKINMHDNVVRGLMYVDCFAGLYDGRTTLNLINNYIDGNVYSSDPYDYTIKDNIITGNINGGLPAGLCVLMNNKIHGSVYLCDCDTTANYGVIFTGNLVDGTLTGWDSSGGSDDVQSFQKSKVYYNVYSNM